MSISREAYRVALRPLLASALRAERLRTWSGGYLTVGGRRLDNRLKDIPILELEDYLLDHSGLPGAQFNRELLAAFADEVQAVCQDESLSLRVNYNGVRWLLDGWRFLATADLAQDDPLVILPCCAAIGTGVHSGVFLAAFEGVRLLMDIASSPLPRVREVVVLGVRRMLAEDWPRTMYELRRYAHIGDAAQHRVAVAAVAGPELLIDRAHALDALDIYHGLLAAFRRLSPSARRQPDAQTLRETFVETIGVLVAAAPATGFALARTWLSWHDPDVRAIVRAGLRSERLNSHQVEVEALLSTSA